MAMFVAESAQDRAVIHTEIADSWNGQAGNGHDTWQLWPWADIHAFDSQLPHRLVMWLQDGAWPEDMASGHSILKDECVPTTGRPALAHQMPDGKLHGGESCEGMANERLCRGMVT